MCNISSIIKSNRPNSKRENREKLSGEHNKNGDSFRSILEKECIKASNNDNIYMSGGK